jgi:hypothetical protein
MFRLRGSPNDCDIGLEIGFDTGIERIPPPPPPPRGALMAGEASAKVSAIAETAAASVDLRIVRLLMDTGFSSGGFDCRIGQRRPRAAVKLRRSGRRSRRACFARHLPRHACGKR